MLCPHCYFPITIGLKTVGNDGASEHVVSCCHCLAILRLQITTLKEPNEERKKRANKADKPTTYCLECSTAIPIGEEHKHTCATVVEKV